MSDVKPVINTAEGANATVPLPAPPSGPSEGAPAHQDGPVSNHDLIEAERAARAGEYGSRRQGVHRPGAEPGGPTMSDGKK